MHRYTFTLLALVACSIAWTVPVKYVEERHIVQIEKRQGNIPQLLQLASLAGITALPTDPAVLFQLAPLANSLASALPTSSVLSVLLTAAPSGFVSSIVNDPSYAASFQSAFSAGHSPSWFNGLPTDVRSYLHTYSGFGGLATAAGAIKGVTSEAGSQVNGASTKAASAASEASSGLGGLSASGASELSSLSGTAPGAAASVTSLVASAASDASSSAGSAASAGVTSESSTEGSTPSSAAPAATGSSSSAQAGAARPTTTLAVGFLGAMGILGVAVAL